MLDKSRVRSKYIATAVLAAFMVFSSQAFASSADTTLGENSAYTLTEVNSPGENVITKYIYDSVSGELTPVYYEVSLNKTTYGSGDNSLSYTVNGINGGTYEITAKYSDNNLHKRITGNTGGEDVQGNFVELSATEGGAISNSGTAVMSAATVAIGNITGDFISNYANNSGGAIYNFGVSTMASATVTIGSITGDFIGNYTNSSGGAIYNSGAGVMYSPTVVIGNITGDFISNYALSETGDSYGGAIYNSSTIATVAIGDINGDFIGNYAFSSVGSIYQSAGGAIYNVAVSGGSKATIGNITGDFISNYTFASGTNSARGGAIYNEGSGYTSTEATIGDIKGDFIGNYAGCSGDAQGGAIYNSATMGTATIGDITGDFNSNYVLSESGNAQGGAIYNEEALSTATIGDITGNFIGNYANTISGSYAYGGAIFNSAEINSITGSFINNYAQSTSGEAKGGAIYTTKNLNLVSTDGYTMVFSGNYTNSEGTIDDNAIYVGSSATLSFTLSNGGSVVMKDNIRGTDGYSVNIKGDDVDNTTFYMLNDMYGANLRVGETTLNTINNDIHLYDVSSFTLTNNINMAVDVDLKNETMDRITADIYGNHQGTLTVTNMNLLSDSTEDKVEILFAETGLMESVKNGTGELPDSYQTTAYTPIYKYNVSYEQRAGDGGYFTFDRSGGNSGGGTASSFNPAVLASSVAAQTGAYTAMLNTFNTSFEHSDYFMKLPSITRLTLRNQNKYAITDTNNLVYKPNELTNDGIWLRPYTSFESIALRNGPKVSTITYGSLFGFDTEFKELRNGWGTVFTGYLGYNGSSQDYSGVDIYQNGGVLGGTQTFYKNNFFTALTATAGASVGDANTMYGHENFTMLMAGVASKTGYSLEFKEGKFIILPTFLMSYSFIDTFNYKNAAGVSIKSDPLHAIQLNPNIRFIANTEKNWQPYATVGMVWNILDKTRVSANDLSLPQMSLKPYIEYGLGIQRHWNERFAGYGQALVRNGGRNGIVITFGFRWALGNDKKLSLVSAPDKKVIKQ